MSMPPQLTTAVTDRPPVSGLVRASTQLESLALSANTSSAALITVSASWA
jgi:hypothetical protein